MSYAMRRELCREATGPTPEEFAAEGATFLVGMVRAAYPDRLAPQYAVTPRDDWFYPYAYVDDIGILVGGLMGNLFGQNKSPDEVRAAAEARAIRQARRAEDRTEARAERRENRTRQAANAFIRWFEERGGDVTDTWTVPNGMGHGVFAEAEDEFTLGAFRKKAREVAAMYRVYFSIVPLPGVSEYLVAFVSEARYTPLSFEDAVSLAEVATNLETDSEVASAEAGMIHVSAPAVDGVGSLDGAAVGSIFKTLFGPKKPEAIKKRIEKLEAELSNLRSKLAEAESKASGTSGGIVVGNIYSRFRAAEGPEYGDSSPAMFRRAGGPEYGDSSPGMFRRAASSSDYGDLDEPAMFRDAEFADFSGAAMTRDEMEDAAVDALEAMLEDGEISQRAFEAFCDRIPDLSDEELADLLADLTGEDAAGFVPVTTTSTATMSRSSKRKLRRQTRRSRRKSRRKARLTRRALRKAMRQSRKKKKSKSPKVIVIRQGGDDEGDDDQPQIININSGDDDDDDDESDGVGAFAYGGPGYGDAALRMGRNFDLPRSPNGFVINYPVG